MKNFISLGARILLGLVFFVFGLNGFFHFIPTPALSPAIEDFTEALLRTGYFLPLLAATETVVGVMLLAGRWVALATVVIAPVVIQIFALHLFIDRQGLPIAIVVVVLTLITAFSQWDRYRPLLKS